MVVLKLSLVFIVCGILWKDCSGKTFFLETESAPGSHAIHKRHGASGGKAVWLKQDEIITLSFCLIRPTSVFVQNVKFSNDGGKDTLSVSVDGQFLGSFQSKAQSNWGRFWNHFDNSGKIGQNFYLEGGWNIITLRVESADDYGIEIDGVEFELSDEEVTEEIFSCSVPCMDDLPYVQGESHYGVTPGRAVQKSFKTQCVEVDNVNIPVFHPQVKEFELTASPPQYYSFANHRDKNTESCPHLSSVFWNYVNVQLIPTVKDLTTDSSRLRVLPKVNGMTMIEVDFSLKGRSLGHIDSEIGSKLFLTLEPPKSSVDIELSYEHRNGTIIKSTFKAFSGNHNSQTWDVPDFTWKENQKNKIKLTIGTKEVVVISNFRMERRYMDADKVQKIYSSDLVIVEAISVDFWWRAPEAMELTRPSTQETWKNIAYFRFYISLPWTRGYSQLLVMYQDGNVRLLNPTPPGMDWIPFGTSVIIGQTNADDFRPSAPISRVELEPEDRSIKLFYVDGGSVMLTLVPSFKKTILYVSDMILKKDTKTHPFATFRSTYINAGNSDMDSIQTDFSGSRRIFGDDSWQELNGTSFLTYRRCESHHLTQSPDIQLDITRV